MKDAIIVYLYNDEIAWSVMYPNFHYPKYLIKYFLYNNILVSDDLMAMCERIFTNHLKSQPKKFLD
jgi:hypothetical protein